jgi:hypothetical protein
MKKILFLTLLLFTSKLFSQSLDTTLVVGIVDGDHLVDSTLSNCNFATEKLLNGRTAVIVSGVTKCTSYDVKLFYQIIFKNQIYYIQKDKLFVSEENFFGRLENSSPETQENFKQNALKYSNVIYLGHRKRLNQFISKTKKPGLTLIDWSFYDMSEYTSGTGIKFDVYNPTNKTIKYIWFQFKGLNAVGDPVSSKMYGNNTIIKVKGIGPIEPETSATYDFKYAWHSDLVDKVKLMSITIQYMDGTTKIVTKPNDVRLPSDLLEFISN